MLSSFKYTTRVIQLYIHIWIYSFQIIFLLQVIYHKMLNIVSCAIQYILAVYLFSFWLATGL